jgi:hypothetical protein
VATLPSIKKDKNGLPVLVGVQERQITQQQADYSDIAKASAMITGEEGFRAREILRTNPNASVGIVAGLARNGAMPDNPLVKTLTDIDAQTQAQRLADIQKESARISTERFNKTGWGLLWTGLKGIARGGVVISNAVVEGLAAPLRSAVDAAGKEWNAVKAGEVDWLGNPLKEGATREELGLLPAEPFAIEKKVGKEFLGQQTVFQIMKQGIQDGKVDIGSGFFPSEEVGAGFKAREEQMKVSKIAFEVDGQTYYRPYSLLSPVSYVLTGGHPESDAARIIDAIGDIGVSVALDPFLAYGRVAKSLREAQTAAQASKGITAAKAAKKATVLQAQLDTLVAKTNASIEAMNVATTATKAEKVDAYIKNFAAMAKVRDEVGRIKIDYDSIATFLSGPQSSHIIDAIADIDDFRKIQKLSKGRLTVDEAVALAKATDRQQVLEAIAPFVADGKVIQRSLEEGTRFSRRFEELTGLEKGTVLKTSRSLTGATAQAIKRMPLGEKIVAIGRKYDAFLPDAGGTLVHVADKDKLIEVVNNVGRSMELDKPTLDKIINEVAFATDSSKSGFQASARLFDAIFDKYASRFTGEQLAEFRKITRIFETERADTAAYWAERHAKGADIVFGLSNGKKVTLHSSHLDSELLNSFVFIPSPKEIQDALRTTSIIGKVTGRPIDALSVFNNVWKKTVMVRPAYISRNIIEEQIRVFGVGHVSFFNHPLSAMAMWLGRDGGPKWKALLNQLDEVRHDVHGNNFKRGSSAEEFNAEVIADDILDPYVSFMAESSLGASGDGEINKILSAIGYQKEVYGHPNWWQGFASQARILHNSEFVKAVLKTKPGKEMDTVNYFLKGAGRPSLDRFIASKNAEFKEFAVTKDGLMKYLFNGTNENGEAVSVLARIEELAGGGEGKELIKKLILDGEVTVGLKTLSIPTGRAIADKTAQLSRKPLTKRAGFDSVNREFANDLEIAFSDLGNWDGIRMVVPVSRTSSLKMNRGEFERLTSAFFSKAVQFEKTSTMGPEWRQSYWDAIRSLVTALDDKAITSLRDDVDGVMNKSLIPLRNPVTGRNIGSHHPVWEALKSADGKGPLTLDEAHQYAANMANKKVSELFYDASKRNLLFHQLRLVFPFLQAWENTLESWGKIALENPLQVYKAVKVGDWLSKSESSALYELTDAKDYYDPNQGFFFSDPTTGEKKFFVPAAALAANILQSILPGGSNARITGPMALSATPQSFNFALGGGSFFPGFGPGLLLSAAALDSINKNPLKLLPPALEEDMYRFLFPYGLPDIKNKGVIDGALLTSNWSRILVAGIAGHEPAYASALAPSMNYLATSGAYNIDNPDDQARLIKDADNLARYFTMWRGVFGALMPIPFAMRPEALAKSKDGNLVLATALWADFKNIEKSVGDNKDKAYGQFIDTYGPEQIFAIIRTTTGYEPTNLPTYVLIRENPSVIDKYPDVYGTFYPNGELSQVLYKFQQMQGTFAKMGAKDIMKAVTNVRYKAAKDRLQARSVAEGWSSATYDEQKKNLTDAYYSRGFDPEKQDWAWRDNAISQLQRAVKDESLTESEALMGARAYLVQRDKALTASGMKTFKNTASEPQREWLAQEAIKLLAKYPDFQKIFYSYFKSELEG